MQDLRVCFLGRLSRKKNKKREREESCDSKPKPFLVFGVTKKGRGRKKNFFLFQGRLFQILKKNGLGYNEIKLYFR